MNRPARSIEILSTSALSLFVTAMGSFAILMFILIPYFRPGKEDKVLGKPGNVLFCVWPTRLKDFEEFVKEVPDAKERGEEFRPDSYLQDDVWRNPGYDQQPDFPVVGVSWLQAQAFCKWLTGKERAAGVIGPRDEYRLPTDAEWTAAAGSGPYPWGHDWPPPPKSGNFADETWAHAIGYKFGFPDMQGYNDGYAMVAPVGSFTPNRFGLFDMAGNVMQWCQDKYRVDMVPPELLEKFPYLKTDKFEGEDLYLMRGSNWQSEGDRLHSYWRRLGVQEFRLDAGGFRCVLVLNSPPGSPPSAGTTPPGASGTK